MALDAAARIAQLREDRWIDYPRAIEALDALEILLTTPPRTRMPCLLIYGDSGMGKTMLIEKLRRAHRPEFDRARRMVRLDVLAVQMPAKPSEARFYSQILAAAGRAHPAERAALGDRADRARAASPDSPEVAGRRRSAQPARRLGARAARGA